MLPWSSPIYSSEFRICLPFTAVQPSSDKCSMSWTMVNQTANTNHTWHPLRQARDPLKMAAKRVFQLLQSIFQTVLDIKIKGRQLWNPHLLNQPKPGCFEDAQWIIVGYHSKTGTQQISLKISDMNSPQDAMGCWRTPVPPIVNAKIRNPSEKMFYSSEGLWPFTDIQCPKNSASDWRK